MKIKTNVKLHNWQNDVIKGVLKFPHDIHVVKAQRQRGKSVCMEMLILYFVLNNKSSKSIYISPSFSQAEKVYSEILKAVRRTGAFKSANGGLFQIHFVNGSQIQFLCASQGVEHLQGYTVNKGILIIDESAFIDDDVHFAVFPFVDANKCPIVMVSTPQFREGTFYDMFIDEKTHHYDWTKYDTTCMLSAERLEQYRKQLPKIKFQQYYLGEFADINTGVFGDFSTVLTMKYTQPIDIQTVIGIDWSTGTCGDETAIAVYNKNTNEMIDLIHFSDKDANDTISYIIDIIKQYKPMRVVVEKNSIGQVFYDILKKKINDLHINTQIQAFITTNDSKEKLVDNMIVAIQNNTIKLLNDETLISQMNNFVAKPLKSGKIQYANLKDNIHDDCVMAALIGYYACYNGGNYVIR